MDLLTQETKRIRKEPTEAEKAFWEIVKGDNLGYKFRRQHVVGNYIADFICLQKQLIIEIDGGYHTDKEQRDYDKQRTAYLNSKGYEVFRFSNEEVLQNTDSVIARLKKKLAQPSINELLSDDYTTLEQAKRDSLTSVEGWREACSVIFGGRLAEYKYYDMAPIVDKVLRMFDK